MDKKISLSRFSNIFLTAVTFEDEKEIVRTEKRSRWNKFYLSSRRSHKVLGKSGTFDLDGVGQCQNIQRLHMDKY